MSAHRTPHSRRASATLVLLLILGACGQPGTDGTKGGFIAGDGTITRVAPADRKPAPPISGNDLDGNPLSLAQFKGKVVVINVWGSWCPPCRKETPALIAVARSTKPLGVQFLGIAIRENAVASKVFTDRMKVPYPSISNDTGSLLLGFTKSLPAIAVPTTYVIDRHGRVAVRSMEPATVSTLTDIVTDIANER
ncbi:MAG: TlpA disulfide reductase family protein [Aeromicrobium sp.]